MKYLTFRLDHAIIINVDYGALAQLGERYTGSVEVIGSIPTCSTKSSKSESITDSR